MATLTKKIEIAKMILAEKIARMEHQCWQTLMSNTLDLIVNLKENLQPNKHTKEIEKTTEILIKTWRPLLKNFDELPNTTKNDYYQYANELIIDVFSIILDILNEQNTKPSNNGKD